MATLNTLQILQKNTLASLQSLIDFTNASFPTSGANHPTSGTNNPTPTEDSLTLTELRPLLQKFYMLDPTIFNVIRLFVDSIPNENPLRKLLPIFSEIQEFHHTEPVKNTPLATEEPETEETNTTLPVRDPEEEEEDNTEIISAYIRPTECFVQNSSGTLTDDQKRYYSLICGQNWRELANIFMTGLNNAFVLLEHNELLNYNMLMHSDPTPKTYVSSSEEYMFLIQCAIANRKIIGNILLPESNILWEHMPKDFLKECNEYYKRNMLFRPATMKYDILTDALKIYRYCKNTVYHKSWSSVVSSQVTLTGSSIRTLLSDWIQGRTVSEYHRDQIMTLLVVSNFAKEDSSSSALTKYYYGSNDFSRVFLDAAEKEDGLPRSFKAWATGGITFKKLKNILTGLGVQQVRRAEGQRYQGIRRINQNTQPNDMRYLRICEPEAYMPGSGFFGITDERDLHIGEDNEPQPYTVLEGFDKPTARHAQPFPIDDRTLTQRVARKEEIKPATPAPTLFETMFNHKIFDKKTTEKIAFSGFNWEQNVSLLKEPVTSKKEGNTVGQSLRPNNTATDMPTLVSVDLCPSVINDILCG